MHGVEDAEENSSPRPPPILTPTTTTTITVKILDHRADGKVSEVKRCEQQERSGEERRENRERENQNAPGVERGEDVSEARARSARIKEIRTRGRASAASH